MLNNALNKWIRLILLSLMPGLLVVSCLKSTHPGLPPEVVKTISETGHNRIELTKAIARFVDQSDSLRLNSVFFLVANIGAHYGVSYRLEDTTAKVYTISPENFSNGDSLLSFWKSLDASTGGLLYQPVRFVLDRDTIESELLISSIEQGLQFPWTQQFAHKDILAWVIPYRIENENINDWRSMVLHDYGYIVDSLHDENAISSIHQWVNHHVDKHYRFDKRYIKQPNVQSYHKLDSLRLGTYRDLAHQKVRFFRSFGIPSTLDYIPVLSDTNHAFAWAVAMDETGRFEAQFPPGTAYLFQGQNKRVPKVYRRIFHTLDSSLYALKPTEVHTPPLLGHFHYLDVTDTYVQVADVSLSLPCPDTLVYLAVENDGEWRAVDWAMCRDDRASFSKVATGIHYKAVYLKNKEITPFSVAFRLKPDGQPDWQEP